MNKGWIRKDDDPITYKCVYRHLWHEIERLFPELGERRRATICNIVTQTCPHCFAANRACKCWNDE